MEWNFWGNPEILCYRKYIKLLIDKDIEDDKSPQPEFTPEYLEMVKNDTIKHLKNENCIITRDG